MTNPLAGKSILATGAVNQRTIAEEVAHVDVGAPSVT